MATSPPSSNRGNKEFNLDLAKALVSANIAFHKLENEEVKDFLEKYTKKKIPSPTCLIKVMECEGKAMLQKVKEKLNGQFIYIAINKTTDSNRRPMCLVLAGSLSSNNDTPSRPYMVDFVNLGTANNVKVQQCVNWALFKVFGGDLDHEKVLLFLTDGAAYCVKVGKCLEELYPNILHCLCLAHGLNRVTELVRYSFPKVDKLIDEIKKNFVKCARRRAEFAASYQVPLPPEPVLTQ